MRAIQVSRYGGPEVLVPTEVPAPVPAADQLLIEVGAAGVNYADTHRTDGSYPTITELPFVPGFEVVGRSADGRRVLAPTFEGGGYAELAVGCRRRRSRRPRQGRRRRGPRRAGARAHCLAPAAEQRSPVTR